MDTETRLKEETEKWLEKIRDEIKDVVLVGSGNEKYLENILAYIQDTSYFISKGDWIRAFEAVIWAWSQLETGKELGILTEK